MKYIRKTYGVPAKRVARIRYTNSAGKSWLGTIKSARGAHLNVQMDEGVDGRDRFILHPTWHVEYL